MDEKRKHLRYKVKTGAFAMLPSVFHRSARVIDISQGGLALHYYSLDAHSPDFAEIDLLFDQDNFRIERLPLKTIFDFEIDPADFHSSLPMRRCSAAFENLTPGQLFQLSCFINNYSV